MNQMYHTLYVNKGSTNADTGIRLSSNSVSKIIFIGARSKGIKLINVQINIMAMISITEAIKVVAKE